MCSHVAVVSGRLLIPCYTHMYACGCGHILQISIGFSFCYFTFPHGVFIFSVSLSLAGLAAVRLFFEKQAILWNDWSFNDTLWYGYNKVNLTVVVCGVLRNEYCSHFKCWLLEFGVYIIVVSEYWFSFSVATLSLHANNWSQTRFSKTTVSGNEVLHYWLQ